jgi:ApaG protein
MKTKTTHMPSAFSIKTRCVYVPERSNPLDNQYFYAYHITITNHGDRSATLKRRHWVITNGLGHIEEVTGEGVVGEQPRFEPGQSFEYSSACPLTTQYGTMQGEYEFQTDDGSLFQVEIPRFELFNPAWSN